MSEQKFKENQAKRCAISEDDQNGDEAEEMEEEEAAMASVKCLFCFQHFASPLQLFHHCSSTHSFNIVAIVNKYHLDFYEYVKMVNFIRKETPPPSLFDSIHPSITTHPWSSDDNLLPFLLDDPLLCFDIECDLPKCLSNPPESSDTKDTKSCDTKDTKSFDTKESNTSDTKDVKSSNLSESTISMTHQQYDMLLAELNFLKKQNSFFSNQLENAVTDLNKMRSSYINRSHVGEFSGSCSGRGDGGDGERGGDGGDGERGGDGGDGERGGEEKNHYDDDDYYFQSYDHYGIHEEMLKDTVRTLAYKEAILQNGDLIRGKKVFDLGCGTCILSMFMATAGAESVLAIDQSDIVYKAMDIVRENSLEATIKCVKGRAEEMGEKDKVDIIVSEWMGYFLLFESMLESVLVVRDKLLKEGGLMFPNKCQMLIGGFSDAQVQASRIDYWDEVYGYGMRALKGDILAEAQVDVLKVDSIVTDEAVICDLDLMTCSKDDLDHSHHFSLLPSSSSPLTGFYVYFTATFDLPHKVLLTTSPRTKPTHWKQTLLLLPPPSLPLHMGQPLEGHLSWKRSAKASRSFNIRLSVAGRVHKYFLD